MKSTMLLIALAVLFTAGHAAAQSEPLRCQARQMRAESEYYRCLSRCDRRVIREAARPADRQSANLAADCDTGCVERFDDDLIRINGKRPCADAPIEPPSPQECEARMLRLASNDLRCQARCGQLRRRDGYDPAACLASCQTRCETGYDELNASTVCAEGRLGTAAVCGTH
jgi:hypothetical protein